jgi:hypothetical protein
MRRLNSIFLFLFLFVFILGENVYSQVANYSFSQSTGTYTPITGGTVSASGSGLDDGIVSVTLPTAFTFNGNSITTVGFSANGYLIMGNTTTHGLIPISSTATSNGVIAALAMDLVANATSSELRWEQIGNEIIFQWKEFKRYNSTPFTNEVFSFQIKINTSTGGINIVYDGSSSVNVSTTRIPQVGLRGTANSDYNARRLTTSVPDSSPSWDDTAAASSNAHNVRFTSTSPAAFPSAGLTFTWTPPSCLAPGGLNTTNITSTSATIGWTAVPSATGGYEWEIRTTGACGSGSPVQSGTTSSTSVNLSGLTANTTYTYCVRSICDGPSNSGWVSASFFTGYCLASSTSQASWISAFSTTNGNSNITHTAGSGAPGGYIDLSATNSVSNFIGNPTNFSITSGGPTVGNAIWVDWNNNLQFETGERMYVSTVYGTTVSGSFAVPAATPNGNYRMRVITDFNNPTPSNPCGNISRGEYKDFNFQVISAPTCFVPTALNISNITNNTSTINWTEPVPPAGVGYEWEVRTSGAAGSGPTGLVASGSVGTGMTMASVSGLTGNTMYTTYVRSDCGAGDFSNWSTGVGFTTSCDAANIPYTQDFESATIPNMPACTSRENAGTGNQWVTANNPGNGFTTRCLQYEYNISNPANAWFYTQGLNLTGGVTYRLTFNYGNNSTSYIEKLKVAYGSTPVNGSMTTQLLDFPTINQGALQNATVDFTPASTGVYYLGFNCYSAANQFNLYVDNISLALAPTDAVDWGNLQWPANGTIFPQNTYVSYGQAWEPGVTDMTGQGAGLNAWVGWSNSNTDPATWPTGNWISAPFNVDAGNNDEFSGTFPANTFTPGTYYYAYRYQLNGGPFRYGAFQGGFWDGTNNVNGVLTVNACPSITPSATPSSICVGDESVLNVTSANTNYTYQWNPGLLSGAMHMVSPVATTQYTVTATDNATGCVTTANISVVVNVLPEGSITPSTPISIDCGDIQELNVIVPSEAKDYLFSPSSGSFTAVVGGTDVNTIEADDVLSGAIPIGFDFTFESSIYSNVKASSNGFLTFNPTATSSASENSASPASDILPFVAPLWEDLDGRATGGSQASYITEGVSPNRVFTMEWLNWEWNYQSSTPVISFQVKLYETTNKIEFVYRQESGAIVPGFSGGATIGIISSASNYLTLNGTGPTPDALDNVFTINLLSKPATGQIYAFERPLATDYEWTGPSGTIFTDMAATIPYTGQNVSTVFVQPTTGGTNTYSVEIEGANGCKSTFDKDIEVGSCAIALNTKVFLTNVSSGTMSDVLRTLPDFPLTDPYTTAPYTTSGLFTFVPAQTPATTTQMILDNNNVVDWVFVELRTGTSGSTTVAASKSGLLKNDGIIINPDGTPFSFSGVAAGNYFIAIKHRNHCGFMTNGTIVVPNPSLLNLTDNSVTLYEPSHPALQLKGTGEYAMWTGDAVVNGAVNGGDVNFVRGLSGVSSGEYNRADVNLNGAVNGADVNAVRGNSGQRTWQVD